MHNQWRLVLFVDPWVFVVKRILENLENINGLTDWMLTTTLREHKWELTVLYLGGVMVIIQDYQSAHYLKGILMFGNIFRCFMIKVSLSGIQKIIILPLYGLLFKKHKVILCFFILQQWYFYHKTSTLLFNILPKYTKINFQPAIKSTIKTHWAQTIFLVQMALLIWGFFVALKFF